MAFEEVSPAADNSPSAFNALSRLAHSRTLRRVAKPSGVNFREIHPVKQTLDSFDLD